MATYVDTFKIVGETKGLDQKMGRSVQSLRNFGLAITAVGSTAVIAGKKLFDLSAAALEVENVTTLAFGRMSTSADQWARDWSEATGSSRFEAIEFASDMGLMIKGMGFAEEEALNMSTAMVELAGDMSSAKNVRLEDALEKIRAGLVGESEPLRVMGVLLSAARVKQVAYAAGIAKTGAELTEAQKVQARMLIILKDSEAMHGDLITTQDSAANSARALTNRWKDMTTELGIALMPMFEKVMGMLEVVTGWVGLLSEAFRDDSEAIEHLVLTGKELVEQTEEQEVVTRGTTDALSRYTDNLDVAAQSVATQTAAEEEAVKVLEAKNRKLAHHNILHKNYVPIARQSVNVTNEMTLANRLASDSIDVQIGLIGTVNSQMGDVSAAIADQGGHWFKWGDLAQGAIGMVGSALGGIAGQVANIGTQLLSGNWMGAIMGAAGMLGKLLGGLGGPDETELANRETYQNFGDEMARQFADVEAYTNEVQTAMSLGQSREIAQAKAAFQVVAEASGRTWDEGSRLHDQFLDAIDSGSQETMTSILSTFEAWKAEGIGKTAEVEAKFSEFFEGVTAEEAPALTEAMIAMFDKAEERGNAFAASMESVFGRVGAAIRAAFAEASGPVGAFAGGPIGAGGFGGGGPTSINVAPAPVFLDGRRITESTIRHRAHVQDRLGLS